MKKFLFTVSAFILLAATGFAQCDKKVLLTSSKTEHYDANDSLQRSDDEKSTIELSKTDVTIKPGGEDRTISGKITSQTCDWSVPFKDGKWVIKATLTDPQGETKNATMTITGKEGKVILLFQLEDMPDRKIRVPIDKFEEVK